MSNMKLDEFAILKSVNMKLNDTTSFILTLQYHVEKGDRSKSRYRWIGRVYKNEDLDKHIAESKSDAHGMDAWKWPDDPTWDGKIYTNDSNRKAEAQFLKNKTKKLVDWDLGVKIMNGWKENKSHPEKSGYNETAKYDVAGYSTKSGQIIDLTNKDELLKHVGENLWKEITKEPKKTKDVASASPVEAPVESIPLAAE